MLRHIKYDKIISIMNLLSSFMREATTVSTNTESRLKNDRQLQAALIKKRLEAKKKKQDALSEAEREAEAQNQIVNFFDEDNIKVFS